MHNLVLISANFSFGTFIDKNFLFEQGFLRCFRDPIRVPVIEYRVPRIREIGSLQVHTGYLTFSLRKNVFEYLYVACAECLLSFAYETLFREYKPPCSVTKACYGSLQFILLDLFPLGLVCAPCLSCCALSAKSHAATLVTNAALVIGHRQRRLWSFLLHPPVYADYEAGQAASTVFQVFFMTWPAIRVARCVW